MILQLLYPMCPRISTLQMIPNFMVRSGHSFASLDHSCQLHSVCTGEPKEVLPQVKLCPSSVLEPNLQVFSFFTHSFKIKSSKCICTFTYLSCRDLALKVLFLLLPRKVLGFSLFVLLSLKTYQFFYISWFTNCSTNCTPPQLSVPYLSLDSHFKSD